MHRGLPLKYSARCAVCLLVGLFVRSLFDSDIRDLSSERIFDYVKVEFQVCISRGKQNKKH